MAATALLEVGPGQQILETVALGRDAPDVDLELLRTEPGLRDPGLAHEAPALIDPEADELRATAPGPQREFAEFPNDPASPGRTTTD